MYCTKCGHTNTEEANFCAKCGNALAHLDDQTMAMSLEDADIAPSLDDLKASQALLVIKGGPSAGSTVLVDKDTTRAGRNPDSDVFLNDITVSRRHAEIMRDGTAFSIKDAGSLNGTYVNRDRVDSAELASGDEVQIGKFKIIFYTAPRS
jgi:pSer/pThr/pTyr-binding forkhead associated (FHA) protein